MKRIAHQVDMVSPSLSSHIAHQVFCPIFGLEAISIQFCDAANAFQVSLFASLGPSIVRSSSLVESISNDTLSS